MWGRQNERTEIPIDNVRKRQTYYGALNLYNKDFIPTPYHEGNGGSTVLFLKHLQATHPDKKLIILWDGASYHDGKEVKKYLDEVNEGIVEKKDWKITCLLFAPNAPEQNPVEDIWLRGKNFLRKHFYENKNFQQIKNHFFNFLNKRIFDFRKIEWYLEIPQAV